MEMVDEVVVVEKEREGVMADPRWWPAMVEEKEEGDDGEWW